jgi:hypothetical protein
MKNRVSILLVVLSLLSMFCDDCPDVNCNYSTGEVTIYGKVPRPVYYPPPPAKGYQYPQGDNTGFVDVTLTNEKDTFNQKDILTESDTSYLVEFDNIPWGKYKVSAALMDTTQDTVYSAKSTLMLDSIVSEYQVDLDSAYGKLHFDTNYIKLQIVPNPAINYGITLDNIGRGWSKIVEIIPSVDWIDPPNLPLTFQPYYPYADLSIFYLNIKPIGVAPGKYDVDVAFVSENPYRDTTHIKMDITVDANTGLYKSVKANWNEIVDMAISPDGRYLCLVDGGCHMCRANHQMWDLPNFIEIPEREEIFYYYVLNPVFSPDNNFFAFCTFSPKFALYNVNNWNPINIDSIHIDDCKDIAFSPDSKHLVSCSFDSTFIIWDTETGYKQYQSTKINSFTTVTWSNDGKNIVLGSTDGTIYIVETINYNVIKQNRYLNIRWFEDIKYNLDDQYLIALGSEELECLNAEDLSLVSRLIGYGYVYGNAFSINPIDDRLVYCTDSYLTILDIPSLQKIVSIPAQASKVSGITWTPDGKSIISSDWRGNVYWWKVE